MQDEYFRHVSIEINKYLKYNKCRKENSIYQKNAYKTEGKEFILAY